MTYSRRSLRHIAYYAFLLVLLMVVGSAAAMAQPSVPPPIVGNGPPDFEDSNPKTPFDTREDYFLRFPFAENAFLHDNKAIHEWDTRVVEGPPDASFFSDITDFLGDVGGSVAGWLGFGTGESSNSESDPINRSQESLPDAESPTAASGPVHITAYPFFIKFCNDNPYQGICYWQAGEAFDRPRTDRDLELFENVLTTFGYPVSDTQFQLIQRENFQRLLELMYDPERYVWMATNTSQMQAASAANSLAGVSEQAFVQMIEYVMEGHNYNGGLLNVANENSATAMNLNARYRLVSAAYEVVMLSYKEIYVPMAILFLLPGAVITQVKATVSKGFDLGDGNPFEGIIRSMVAIFLIPGTQVIVSYSIDVGNSMATTAEEWVDTGLIIEWQHELTYNVNPHTDHANVIEPPEADQNGQLRRVVFEGQNGEGDDDIVNGNPNSGGGGGGGGLIGRAINAITSFLSWLAGTFAPGVFGSGGEGLGANVPEGDTTQEEQLALSQAMQFIFNGATFIGALTIIILTAFQVVIICYLFLLGPLSAAFFAWPQVGEKLFRNVFSNWVYAVIMVSLWRFYWVIGLVIMTRRLLFINHPDGVHLGTGDLQWEVAVFVCILALMIWTSINPFAYDPAKAFEFVQDFVKASEGAGKALAEGAGGEGGVGGQGGQSGSGSGGGNQDNQSVTPSGGSDSSSEQNTSPTDSAADRVESSGGGGESSGEDSTASDAESGEADSRTESMANDSPPDANAPPMESGGGGSGGADGGSGGDTQAPPSSQTDAMMAGGAAGIAASAGESSSESSEAGDEVASSGYEARQMPEDSAPVDRSPGESNAQTGNFNQDADAAQAQAGIASQSQPGGDSDSSGSGGSKSAPGEMNISIGQDGDDSGGSSDPPPPPNLGNIQPPPMTDSSDDE